MEWRFIPSSAHWLSHSMPRRRIARRSRALKLMPPRQLPDFPSSLAVEVAGLRFPSPVGLAAGFDKDAEVPDAMLGLGFGFVEVGTVTPLPQAGNPKPRLFRLAEDQAVINRMGFNNQRPGGGARAASAGANGAASSGSTSAPTRTAPTASPIMSRAFGRLRRLADYLTVNISSPNTPGLRGLQDEGALAELLGAVREARAAGGPPMFLKVAPDLNARRSRADRARCNRQSNRRADRRQHNGVAAAAQVAFRRRGGGPFGRAAEAACARSLARIPRRERRRDPADRGRRDRQRRRCVGADPRGCQSRAALQRAGLPRAGAGAAHRRWARRAAAREADMRAISEAVGSEAG